MAFMSIQGLPNQTAPPPVLSKAEFYRRELDTLDGLATYKSELPVEAQQDIEKNHTFRSFSNYQEYINWYDTLWPPSDTFSPALYYAYQPTADAYTDVLRGVSTSVTNRTEKATPDRALSTLKGFLTENLASGIDTIDATLLHAVQIGDNVASGMAYQMLTTFVAGMAANGLLGAGQAIKNVINAFANPLP